MSLKKFCYSVIFITSIFSIAAFAKEPPNLALVKEEIKTYHDSGSYAQDVRGIVNQAEKFLLQRVKESSHKKLAVVLDIDETSLSNYRSIAQNDFYFSKKLLREIQNNENDLPILATRHLYNLAKQQGLAVFFVTGRPVRMKQITINNLHKAGFDHWDGIYFKPDSYHLPSVVSYKSSVRKQISDQGYDIIINIGDQMSDLAGGYSDRSYKLPNPFYFIP